MSVHTLGFFHIPPCEISAFIKILPSFLIREKVNLSEVILEDIIGNTRIKQRVNAREGECILLHLLSSILKCHWCLAFSHLLEKTDFESQSPNDVLEIRRENYN